jgi:hypothetical protein
MKTYKYMIVYDNKLNELIRVNTHSMKQANKEQVIKNVKYYLSGKAPHAPHLDIDLDDTDRYSLMQTNTLDIKPWTYWNQKQVWVDREENRK